jgi:hypothetical protein
MWYDEDEDESEWIGVGMCSDTVGGRYSLGKYIGGRSSDLVVIGW